MGKRTRIVYRRGDVRLGWRGRTAVAEYRDAGGNRCRTRLGEFKTDAEAKVALDRFADARAVVKAQNAKYTVGDLWAMWLDERAKDGLSNAIYEANWVSLSATFASRRAELITADDCRSYARTRFDLGRAPATVATELVRLRTCLRWAAAEDLISKVPRIWVPARGEPRQRVLTVTEAGKLWEAAGDPHIHLFIVLALATGARHMAILDLTWDRVDWVKGTIQYDEDVPVDPMSKRWTKGRATVPMGSRVRQELERAYQMRQTDHVIEHGGRRLKTVREGFANAVRRAGLSDDITPHTIRHSVSTWLKEKGVALERRAQLLGHTDTRTTDIVYSHADATYLGPAVDLLDSELAALPQKYQGRVVASAPKTTKKRRSSQRDNSKFR